MRAYIPDSVTLIINTVRDKGISSSIAAAVEYLKESAYAIMFMVADQPMIGTGTLDYILSTFRQNPSFIVASSVDGDVRNPINDSGTHAGDHSAHCNVHNPMNRSLPAIRRFK